jgi:hypothetical protein
LSLYPDGILNPVLNNFEKLDLLTEPENSAELKHGISIQILPCIAYMIIKVKIYGIVFYTVFVH